MDLFGHLASSCARALLWGLANAPTSQAVGQGAVGWHQWCHRVTLEVSPAGGGSCAGFARARLRNDGEGTA